jgi:pyruvate ferredoxin oxidoreductase alpha subunit
VAATLAGCQQPSPVLRSFVGGLGGKEISPAEFDSVLHALETPATGTGGAPPVLLMTAGEWNQVQQVLSLAGKTQEVGP